MAKAKEERSAKSGSTRSSSSSTGQKSGLKDAKASSRTLRPLSSVFGAAASSSTASTSLSRASSSPKKTASTSSKPSAAVVGRDKARNGRKGGDQASEPGDPIELSSDDEVEPADDFFEIQDNDSKTEGSDDEVTVTAFRTASKRADTSGATPQTSAALKTQGETAKKSRSTNSSQAGMSEKAKGKQKAADVTEVELEVVNSREDALWSQKYAPMDFESLCVHKKKVQDVQRWLEEAYAGGVTGKYRRILLLSGPAGSAKTAALRVLAREMDIDITEYKTSEGNSESSSNQFSAFLAKSTLASTLQFGVLTSDNKVAMLKSENAIRKSEESSKPKTSTLNGFTVPKASSSSSGPVKKRRLILVEDLPNIFTSTGTRDAFRKALISLASSKRVTSTAANANVPLAIIVSEALKRPGQNEGESAANRYQGNSEQSVSVRSVVPAEVLQAPVTAEFKFNPVAATLMKKALNAILDREYATMPAKRPSQRAVQIVIEASDGDIRSALNTLQFILGVGGPTSEVALENAKQKGKKRKSNGKVKDDGEQDEAANKALLHLVATKESSLFLFHALGKVLFNKRWGENPDEDAKSTKPMPSKPEKLPAHDKRWDRRASKVDTNVLFSDAPVESDMFMSYLHQNYPPFCDKIEDCMNMMEYMSMADSLMRMEGDSFSRHALTSHYSFQVAVRGALLSLPSPVQRRGQKMYKSEIWETQRKAKENSDRAGDLMAILGKRSIAEEDSDGLLPKKQIFLLETLAFLGMMQAPERSFVAKMSRNTGPNAVNPFKQPKAPSGPPNPTSRSSNLTAKQRESLLNLAFFSVPAHMQPKGDFDDRNARVRESLNEKDVPDDEDDEDDLKAKPTAPAVQIQEGEEEEEGTANDEAIGSKLYLSDDDIGNF